MARRFGFVTDARHDRVTLDPAVVHLACLLDGTRDRTALLKEMRELAEKKAFKVTLDDALITSEPGLTSALERIIDTTLKKFANAMLLVPAK